MNDLLRIEYRPPVNDPHKLPRPHYVLLGVNDDGYGWVTTGGEIGNVAFLGIHPFVEEPSADAGYLDNYEIDLDDLGRYVGWHAAFEDPRDDERGPFTYEPRIASITVDRSVAEVMNR